MFDFQKAAPIQSLGFIPVRRRREAEIDLAFTQFPSDPTTALTAAVTEMAYYTVPSSLREEAKPIIEATTIPETHPVITVGGSPGGAVGWGK